MYYASVMIIASVTQQGCTIKVEPLSKTPVKQHRKSHSAHPRRTPHPTPTASPQFHEIHPLHLEPTSTPVPLIQVPPTAWQKDHIHPMDMYM